MANCADSLPLDPTRHSQRVWHQVRNRIYSLAEPFDDFCLDYRGFRVRVRSDAAQLRIGNQQVSVLEAAVSAQPDGRYAHVARDGVCLDRLPTVEDQGGTRTAADSTGIRPGEQPARIPVVATVLQGLLQLSARAGATCLTERRQSQAAIYDPH